MAVVLCCCRRDLQKEARERIRATAQDLKELVLLEGACVTLEPQRRLQRQRLSTDFGDLLKAFERVEKATAKKERELVNKTRATVEEKSAALIQLEDDAGYSRGALPLQPSSQVQRCVTLHRVGRGGAERRGGAWDGMNESTCPVSRDVTAGSSRWTSRLRLRRTSS
jgi:hypothetical protein